MFDFDSDLQFAGSSPRIVALRQVQQSLESRQRDIYETHRHRIFALAYYMTGNEIEAEQILASTFVRAFLAAQEPESHDVDGALLQELQQKSYFHQDAASADPTPTQSFAGLVKRNVKRTDLEEAMQGLEPRERLLFLLHDVEGYSPADIAQLLQMPQPQVQRGVFTARMRLRGILAEAQAA